MLASMHDWLKVTRMTVANGGGTAKGDRLQSEALAGTLPATRTVAPLPIDNNPVENAIRPICLGKKNWLFTGSERAGKRAAAIQSLLATAALNGLDPAAWLRSTLGKTARPVLNSEIDSLLPLRQSPLLDHAD
jgi:transposase